MIGFAHIRLVQAASLSAALLMSSAAFAQDETTRQLAEYLRAVEALSAFGDDVKVVVSTDLGFSDAQVAQWASAVEVAFERDLLEAEFIAALESRLSEPVRQAAVEYHTSPLGEEVVERVANAPDIEEAPDFLDEAKADLAAMPDDRRALLETQFKLESATAQNDAVMTSYFRAMQVAATPVIGADAAEQWVTSAQYLRDEFNESHFLTYVSVYSQLPDERHEELVAILSTPEMIEFYTQSVEAYAETLHAAVDRVEAAYANGSNQ